MSRVAVAAVMALVAAGAACGSGRDATGRERGPYRRVHREYDGAPPVVPHAVASLQRQDCLSCHRDGMDLGDAGLAPTAPHAERVLCLQCHVEQVTAAAWVTNGFAGARWPPAGARAYRGAPPTLPHPRQGRESCPGCHGDKGGSPIRTPHPDRVNCLQCHVEALPQARLYRGNDFGGLR